MGRVVDRQGDEAGVPPGGQEVRYLELERVGVVSLIEHISSRPSAAV
jgi:hypothetical protein